MKRRFILFNILLCVAGWCMAQRPARFHNESSDTTKITNLLISLDKMKPSSIQELVAEAGREFIGTPYVASTLEIEPEMVTVNLDELDCTTFVETAVAMAMTVINHRTSWHDYIYNLEQLRYRNGSVNGYPSRLHYISDWIVDNNHRGNLQEVTSRVGKADYAVKTLDFMSTHRNSYKALKDSANFAQVKNAEVGYRSHRFPYIKTMNVKSADIKEGDIIAITTNVKGLDVSHLGIATLKDGVVHLMHASSKAGKVIIDPLPLSEYLRKNRSATGIRVIRIKE